MTRHCLKNLRATFAVLAALATALTFAGRAEAQLTGTKNIPGDYATLAAAITDLNTQGVGAGGVTLNLIAGNPQTAPAGGYVIGGTGSAVLTTTSAANQVVLEGNGNTITASAALTAGALNDAIFKLIGADYITIQNFTMQENAANTTTTAASNNMTEWGVALLYVTTTDGAQNNTIQNNTITLNRAYQNTFGVYANATHSATAPTTSATATGANGGNHGLKIYGNNVSNVNNGIIVVGPTAAADANTGVDVGGSGGAQANNVTNFGTTGTFSSYANVSGTVNGILVRNSNGYNVSYNTVTSSVGGTTAGTLNGIQIPAASTTPTGTFTNNITNNAISLQSAVTAGAINGINAPSGSATATSTLNINNNNFASCGHTVAGASGTITFITTASTHQNLTINSNTFTNLSVNTTGSVTFISASYSAPATGSKTINGNSIVGTFAKTGAGGTIALYSDAGSSTCTTPIQNNNNNFSNITVTGATTISGWFNNDGTGATPPKTITGNTFSNWTCGTNAVTALNSNFGNTNTYSNNTITNITGQGSITGMQIGSSGTVTTLNMASNTITGLSSTGAGGAVTGISSAYPGTANITSNTIGSLSSTSTTATVVGITSSGTTPNINSNTISTLSCVGSTSGVTNGIMITGGTTVTVSKNRICDLATTGAFTTTPGVNGIVMSSGTNVTASNNLIGDLRAPAANSTDAIRGISVTATTTSSTFNVYYNTVNIAASSTGAAFGTSGLFHAASATATTAVLNARNNLIVNTSTPNGVTGLTVAFRRSSGVLNTLNNYGSASNNNDFYAGTPGPNNLIYSDGTSSAQTIALYKAGVFTAGTVAPRDSSSFSENPSFLSTVCGNASFLHINTVVPTGLESGAANIAGITDDYDADIRQGNPGYIGTGGAPDVGADEFEGTSTVVNGACCTALVLSGCVFTDQTTCLNTYGSSNWSSGVVCAASTCPPGNDLCANAPTLATDNVYVAGTTSNATNDGAATCDSGGGGSRDVWYKVTVPAGCGYLNIDTCTSTIDTTVAVYSGVCGALTEIACNDDCGGSPCGATSSCLALSSVSAGTYYVRVSDKGGTAGAFNIRANLAPPNDECSGASPISDGVTPICMLGATTTTSPAACSSITKDVWFSYLATCTGPVTVTNCGQLPTGYDTVIAVYSGTCGALTQLTCSDGGGTCGFTEALASFTATAGTTYYFRVGTFSTTASQNMSLSVSSGTPDLCANAQALTLGAAAISGSTSCATNDGTATCDAAGRDVWYKVTLSTSLTAFQALVIDTCGSTIDTTLAAYTGTCGSLTEVACNDDSGDAACGLTSSRVQINGPITAPITYTIRVSDKNIGSGGLFQIKAATIVINDTCANAIAVTCGSTTAGTTVGATAESPAPPAGCNGPTGSGSQSLTYTNGVWYKFTLPGTPGVDDKTVTADTLLTAYDSKVWIFTGGCGALTCVTMNDDVQGTPFQSKAAWRAVAGQEYQILVGPFSTTTGNFTLRISCDDTPANDLCANAGVISGASGTTPFTTIGATGDNNTTSAAMPSCNGAYSFFDVWYQITACSTGNLTLNTCGAYDTILSVHTACPTLTLSNQLTPTASSCNNDGTVGCTPGSQVTVAVTQGTTYWIRVVGSVGAAAGNSGLLTWSLPDTTAPNITTCASNQSANANASCQAAVPDFTAGVVATDNCSAVTVTQSPLAGTLVGLGVTNVTLTATDASGNFSTCPATFTVTDVTPPSISTCGPAQSASADVNCQAAVPDFTATTVASDNCSFTLSQSPAAGTLVGLGVTNVTITATDGASLTATCGTTFTVTDTTPPSHGGTCPANITVNADPGQTFASNVSWTPPTWTDNCTNPVTDITASHTPPATFPIGVTSVTYTAKDDAMNTATCSFTITVVDAEAPNFNGTCPTSITVNADPGACGTVVSWTPPTATDNNGTPTVTQTQGPAPGSTFNVGTTHIQYTATDAANNTTLCDFDVIVVDDQDPVIVDCPSNISVNTDAGVCTAVVSWTAPTFTDNCPGGSIAQTAGPASGSAFPLGATMVTYTATDASNRTATCSFTVTVTDAELPSITDCGPAQTANADANCQAVVPDFTAAVVATDNCTSVANQVITQVPAAGTLVSVGVNNVAISVKDQANNTATCNNTFTVSDVTSPTILGCPANIVTNVNALGCNAVVAWIAPTVSDNCAGASIAQTSGPASGSTFANGSVTTITYTATDAANNTASCSFTVSVVAAPDVNNDGIVDVNDVLAFVNVLTGVDTDPVHVARCDVNCDGAVNGLDVQPFADIITP